jgi:hypothetical protein
VEEFYEGITCGRSDFVVVVMGVVESRNSRSSSSSTGIIVVYIVPHVFTLHPPLPGLHLHPQPHPNLHIPDALHSTFRLHNYGTRSIVTVICTGCSRSEAVAEVVLVVLRSLSCPKQSFTLVAVCKRSYAIK